ncbi:DUF5750 family protein [Methanobacterium paludis]|uniref:Uncharacterized protein n=1 Tax=Methanobacterium paludis (strain DSM 25820 / JCM 18151 / SWAN1) TaxID=868131 RepID=F6D5I1_METPW|nr:DUF5750 family protein [Methanobacterium paludis]AEG19333.1 hypothetical protein MSWAN_2328 [Methanobacterium paludis]
MEVKIVDYGASTSSKRYYVTCKVTGIDLETQKKLEKRVEGKVTLKNGDMYITTYFEEEYFPFKSQEAQYKPEDFVAREEIEMIVYLTSLLEED